MLRNPEDYSKYYVLELDTDRAPLEDKTLLKEDLAQFLRKEVAEFGFVTAKDARDTEYFVVVTTLDERIDYFVDTQNVIEQKIKDLELHSGFTLRKATLREIQHTESIIHKSLSIPTTYDPDQIYEKREQYVQDLEQLVMQTEEELQTLEKDKKKTTVGEQQVAQFKKKNKLLNSEIIVLKETEKQSTNRIKELEKQLSHKAVSLDEIIEIIERNVKNEVAEIKKLKKSRESPEYQKMEKSVLKYHGKENKMPAAVKAIYARKKLLFEKMRKGISDKINQHVNNLLQYDEESLGMASKICPNVYDGTEVPELKRLPSEDELNEYLKGLNEISAGLIITYGRQEYHYENLSLEDALQCRLFEYGIRKIEHENKKRLKEKKRPRIRRIKKEIEVIVHNFMKTQGKRRFDFKFNYTRAKTLMKRLGHCTKEIDNEYMLTNGN